MSNQHDTFFFFCIYFPCSIISCSSYFYVIRSLFKKCMYKAKWIPPVCTSDIGANKKSDALPKGDWWSEHKKWFNLHANGVVAVDLLFYFFVETWLQEHVCIVWFHFARLLQIFEFSYTLGLNLSEDFILFNPKPPQNVLLFPVVFPGFLSSCPFISLSVHLFS